MDRPQEDTDPDDDGEIRDFPLLLKLLDKLNRSKDEKSVFHNARLLKQIPHIRDVKDRVDYLYAQKSVLYTERDAPKKSIESWEEGDVKVWSEHIRIHAATIMKDDAKKDDFIPEVVAVLKRVFYLAIRKAKPDDEPFHLRESQMLAVLLLILRNSGLEDNDDDDGGGGGGGRRKRSTFEKMGRFIQVGTGEGKTYDWMVVAAFYGFTDKVAVVTSSPVLARDATKDKEILTFFNILGLKFGDNTDRTPAFPKV